MKKKLPTIFVKQLKALESFLHKIFKEEYPELKKVKKGVGRPKKEIDKQKLFQLRKEGKTIREIARQLNASCNLAYRRLKEIEEKYPELKTMKNVGGRPRKKIDVKKILELRKEGKSIPKIAKHMDVSVGFIYKILKEDEVKE